MGAWIETNKDKEQEQEELSHPMWVRGLKHSLNRQTPVEGVAPYVGAWIETIPDCIALPAPAKSHPMWVRGLKPKIRLVISELIMSHPMWVRGLKPMDVKEYGGYKLSRTLCGCVD